MLLIEIAKRMKRHKGYRDIPIKDIVDCLRTGFDVIREILVEESKGSMLQISRFGTFRVIETKASERRNPKDGSHIVTPARLKVRFKLSEVFNKQLNKGRPYSSRVVRR
jgi:nucleoid DNA-binding protein